MKRTIIGMAVAMALVFTATAWSQESPMERGKMGMGKMETEEVETEERKEGGSSETKACMQMMGEMEKTNAALDELVGRMQAAEGAEKVAAIEQVNAARGEPVSFQLYLPASNTS